MRKLKREHIKYLVLLSVLFLVERLTYNHLVDEAHFLHIAHGRLEAEQQRRHDIVKGIVGAVHEYVEVEGMVFDELVTLNGMIESGVGEAELNGAKGEIVMLLNKLTFLVENYPDIRANGPYLFLMKTLQKTGQRVTRERINYNNSACEYNKWCNLFPINIIARIHGFRNESFFEAEKGAGRVPKLHRYGEVL